MNKEYYINSFESVDYNLSCVLANRHTNNVEFGLYKDFVDYERITIDDKFVTIHKWL